MDMELSVYIRPVMSVIFGIKWIGYEIADMKYKEAPLLSSARLEEIRILGRKLARLRMARQVRQADAAARAGMSRSTAALIEKGDPGRTIGQLLRYLDAIAPGISLLALLQESDPSLITLSLQEQRKRARPLSNAEMKELDF